MIRKGLVVALFLLALPGVSSGAFFTLTDTTSGVPGTVYDLTITDLGSGNFSATLEADTITASGWFINWWDIQFDGSTPTAGTMTVSPSAAWNYVGPTASVDLEGFNNFPQNKRLGAYTDGIVAPATVASIQDGAALNGSDYTWTFTFSLTDGLVPIAFQVGYYDGLAGGSNNILQTRLSQEFQVPEPGTVLLLGSGLLGLGMLRRKFRG